MAFADSGEDGEGRDVVSVALAEERDAACVGRDDKKKNEKNNIAKTSVFLKLYEYKKCIIIICLILLKTDLLTVVKQYIYHLSKNQSWCIFFRFLRKSTRIIHGLSFSL